VASSPHTLMSGKKLFTSNWIFKIKLIT
jgi:hypothetical protein